MKIKLAALIITVFFTSSLFAKVSLPDILSDNMLLQQNTQVNIWGKADANKTVNIKISWSKKTIKIIADESGNWKTSFATPATDGKSQTITISDGKTITLKNILLGELWFCSGQSNMEMPMKGFKNQPVEN